MITITRGRYPKATFTSIDFPSPGETVAEHSVFVPRRGLVRREIHVGTEPWDSEGNRGGVSVSSRIVATFDEKDMSASSLSFDRLLFEIAVEVIQREEEGSVPYMEAGKLVFRMREHNMVPRAVPVACASCLKQYEAENVRRLFGPEAAILWFKNESSGEPVKMCTTTCLDCLEETLKNFKESRREALEGSKMSVDEFILSGRSLHDFTGDGTSWDHAIGKIKARIDDIRRTK